MEDRKLGVATKDEVIVFANSTGLAASYPKQPNTYDGLYLPRASDCSSVGHAAFYEDVQRETIYAVFCNRRSDMYGY